MLKNSLLLLALALSLSTFAVPAAAQKPTSDSMMHMLKLSGTMDILNPVMQQMAVQAETDLRKALPTMPQKAWAVVSEELSDGANHLLRHMLALQMDYYSDHLTQQDVDELIGMYESRAWKKLIAVGQRYVNDEFQDIMQNVAPKLAVEMIEGVLKRLVDEGYISKEEAGV